MTDRKRVSQCAPFWPYTFSTKTHQSKTFFVCTLFRQRVLSLPSSCWLCYCKTSKIRTYNLPSNYKHPSPFSSAGCFQHNFLGRKVGLKHPAYIMHHAYDMADIAVVGYPPVMFYFTLSTGRQLSREKVKDQSRSFCFPKVRNPPGCA